MNGYLRRWMTTFLAFALVATSWGIVSLPPEAAAGSMPAGSAATDADTTRLRAEVWSSVFGPTGILGSDGAMPVADPAGAPSATPDVAASPAGPAMAPADPVPAGAMPLHALVEADGGIPLAGRPAVVAGLPAAPANPAAVGTPSLVSGVHDFLVEPTPVITPDDEGLQIINLETWLAVELNDLRVVSSTQSGGGWFSSWWIQRTAYPLGTEWTFADGHEFCSVFVSAIRWFPGGRDAPCGHYFPTTTTVRENWMEVRIKYLILLTTSWGFWMIYPYTGDTQRRWPLEIGEVQGYGEREFAGIDATAPTVDIDGDLTFVADGGTGSGGWPYDVDFPLDPGDLPPGTPGTPGTPGHSRDAGHSRDPRHAASRRRRAR